MTNKEKLLLDWLKYISQGLSCVIFLYIFIVHLLNILFPIEKYIDQGVFDISYLRSLIFLGFVLAFISWMTYILRKSISFVSPFTYSRSEKFYYLSIASLFTIFYIGIFSGTHLFRYFIFFLLLLFFYVLIPQLIYSYLSIKLVEVKSLIEQTFILIKKKELLISLQHQLNHLKLTLTYVLVLVRKPNNSSFQIQELNKKMRETVYSTVTKTFSILGVIFFILFSLGVILLSFFQVVRIFTNYIQGDAYQNNLRRKQLFITKINPQKALNAHKVELEGYHFGWKTGDDSRYNVMTSDGPIKLIEEWTNERLDFIVPLDFSTGKKQVWIEKPTDDPNSNQIIKSNIVTLEVFSRFNLYPAANDSFYQRAIKKVKKFIYLHVPIVSNLMLP